MMRVLLALMLSGGVTAGLTDSVAAGDPDGKGPMRLTRAGDVLSWSDQDGEAGYHVFGNVDYWSSTPCTRIDGRPPISRVEFDEELPANTTSYQLPKTDDSRLTVLKGLTFRVDAVDSLGEMIASDASGFAADAFCTPEEMAAAGSGPSSASDAFRPISVALAAFGAIAISSGLLLRRRPS